MTARRVLMTLDAVGGVWRYAMDLAGGLCARGIETVFLGFGPEPTAAQRHEAMAAGQLDWCDVPLDWMVGTRAGLHRTAPTIAERAARHGADLIQTGTPSQATGLPDDLPVVTVAHSCVATWFRAVRAAPVPPDWSWQVRLTAEGFARADAIVAPSRAHARALSDCYSGLGPIAVVPNAVSAAEGPGGDRPMVAALARWWDEGKNGATLDLAAGRIDWPVVMIGPVASRGARPFAANHASTTGPLPHVAAEALMRQAGILCAPSIYEPFGLAVAEAARAARPLVLADIPTFREYWDGAALFHAPRDAEALARQVTRLSRDPMLRRRMGQAAQRRATSLRVEAQARAMAQIYNRLGAPALPHRAEA